jgi:hypothetical protein
MTARRTSSTSGSGSPSGEDAHVGRPAFVRAFHLLSTRPGEIDAQGSGMYRAVRGPLVGRRLGACRAGGARPLALRRGRRPGRRRRRRSGQRRTAGRSGGGRCFRPGLGRRSRWGSALAFGGADYVSVPDTASLEPAHVAVDAWVRRAGSPGAWRYVLSEGSLDCDRSAYGLYSDWAGGMSFYVSNRTSYFISPEVPAATVWDGNWRLL